MSDISEKIKCPKISGDTLILETQTLARKYVKKKEETGTIRFFDVSFTKKSSKHSGKRIVLQPESHSLNSRNII